MRPPQIRLALLLISGLLLLTLVLNVSSCQQERASRLGPGSTGLRVTAVQWLLNAKKIDVSITGTFAQQTNSAVRGFQEREGLSVTGQVDQRTFDRLIADTREGDRGLQVRAVQTLLHLQGNRVGVHDTFDGPTADAVRAFQRTAELDATGAVDRDTWRALFKGPKEGPPVTEAEQFFATIAPMAREAKQQYGVPAAVAMAQAAQETGWGRSAPNNNYFGVKCHNQSPGPIHFECRELATGEWENGQQIQITDKFRAYATMRDSFLDYGNFLQTNSRYGPAFAVAGDPDAFARALQQAGYATDPTYADSLIQIMQQRDLYKYDR